MAEHRLDASPATVRWGEISAAFAPVLTVASGERVRIGCVSGAREVMPPPESGFVVPAALAAIQAAVPRGPGHIVTGPVAVAGAEPGDMLEVRIEAVEFATDWGYCGFRPLMGTLPEDFPERVLSHIAIDRARRVCRLPWGGELPLAPFFGVMAVAPPSAYGTVTTVEPREYAGNMDNRHLVAGSTLFLPVFAPGALFSVGDGHGVQGDGEVCINALECCLDGTFTLVLHKRAGLVYPRAETPTHYISMGFDRDLDQAMKKALREMIAFIAAHSPLSRQQAYQLCSLAADFHVTQTVNGEQGVHGLLRKDLLDGFKTNRS